MGHIQRYRCSRPHTQGDPLYSHYFRVQTIYPMAQTSQILLEESNGMKAKLIIIILLFPMIANVPVSAQTPNAAIAISCGPLWEYDAYPDANTTTNKTCTLDNPTNYEENVSMLITHDGGFSSIEIIEGQTITLGPYSEKIIHINATVKTPFPERFTVSISARVQSINGNELINTASSQNNLMAYGRPYDNFSLQIENQIITLDENNLGFDNQSQTLDSTGILITNNGNYASTYSWAEENFCDNIVDYNIGCEYGSLNLGVGENSSLKLNLTRTIDLEENTQKINTSSWTKLSNGTRLLTLNASFQISVGDVAYCYQCNNTVNTTLEIYYVFLETESNSLGAMLLLGLLVGFVILSAIVIGIVLVLLRRKSDVNEKIEQKSIVIEANEMQKVAFSETDSSSVRFINLEKRVPFPMPSNDINGTIGEDGYEWTTFPPNSQNYFYRVPGTTEWHQWLDPN